MIENAGQSESAEKPLKEMLEFYKCERCPCIFVTEHDFGLHKHVCEENLWRDSDYDNSKITLATNFPELARTVKISGCVTNALYKYTLCGNGKWLKRRPA